MAHSRNPDLTLRNSEISLENVLGEVREKRKTKIVCTIGPACNDVQSLKSMIDSGMNVARLNFSHGDHTSHEETLRNVRAAAESRPGCHLAVMLDTKGPEIRTGMLPEGVKSVELKKNTEVVITTDYDAKSSPELIACSYKNLPYSVKKGSVILIADGSITLRVTELSPPDSVKAVVLNTADLGSRKNMNLPGVVVDLPTVTEKDVSDIVDFGLKHGVDFVAASFVRKALDVESIRGILDDNGGQAVGIIAKIENQEGLENFDEILKSSVHAIMVARGDLGMEIPAEKVFLAQKMMIRKCNVYGKPVITATQMLESMVNSPRPTRAEATDVANAVLDGSDCVMLSGETAAGRFPLVAVQTMSSICREAESAINYSKLYLATRNTVMGYLGEAMTTQEAIASSAVKTSMDMGAAALIVLTESGNTARLVAKYRPKKPILVVTVSPIVARQVNGLVRGAISTVPKSMKGTDSVLRDSANVGKTMGLMSAGALVVAVHGSIEELSGASNMVKVLAVE